MSLLNINTMQTEIFMYRFKHKLVKNLLNATTSTTTTTTTTTVTTATTTTTTTTITTTNTITTKNDDDNIFSFSIQTDRPQKDYNHSMNG